jgi:hypothetical protein
MTQSDLAKVPIGQQLATLANDAQLAPPLAKQITDVFSPYYAQAEKILDDAATVAVTDASDLKGMEKAKTIRLTLKHLRGSVEKSRVAMTADALKVKSTVDLVARTLRTELEAAEGYLEEQEKFAERGRQMEALGCDPSVHALGTMPEKSWKLLLAACHGEHTLRVEEERKAKEAAAQAEKDRQEALARAQAEAAQAKKEKALADQKLRDAQSAADLERRKAEQEKREADTARMQLEQQRQAEGAKIARLAREKEEAAQRKADADAAAAKKNADAKLAEEARKRKAVEAAAGAMLEALIEAEKALDAETTKHPGANATITHVLEIIRKAIADVQASVNAGTLGRA